jgi:hypothetical protein
MSVEEKIQNRITQLINDAIELGRHPTREDYEISQAQISECIGWLGAAQNIVELACPTPLNAYRTQLGRIMAGTMGSITHSRVQEAAALLSRLAIDLNEGLIASIVDQAAAETFDNFLDHADAYLGDGRKNEAGVIAGVVFEDTVRRIYRKNSASDAGKNLDDLISALAKSQVISATKAKRARTGAHVRTKATHAQWDEFDAEDVKETVRLTRQLLDDHLD